MVEKSRLFSQKQFSLIQRLCAAPSPIGFESAMVDGVILPELEAFKPEHWQVHRFAANAGVVIDTNPDADDALTIMPIGHADKIRLQVRRIGDDGKIWVDSESFLPISILGHRFNLFIEVPDKEGTYRVLEGLTAQAFGAIHFVKEELESGEEGIEASQVYLETGLYGDNCKEKLEKMGVRPGQVAVFARSVERGPTKGTFYGAYLDNALGCFTVLEAARKLAASNAKYMRDLRVLFTIASHEEIGWMGSRVAAGVHRPDIIIGLDVSHDYQASPDAEDKTRQPVAMGKGCVVSEGAAHSYPLMSLASRVARYKGIRLQHDVVGSISGVDSMAAPLSAIDAAALDIGFPIRNMHTASEIAHDGDVLSGIKLLVEFLRTLGSEGWTREALARAHLQLSYEEKAKPIEPKFDEDI